MFDLCVAIVCVPIWPTTKCDILQVVVVERMLMVAPVARHNNTARSSLLIDYARNGSLLAMIRVVWSPPFVTSDTLTH